MSDSSRARQVKTLIRRHMEEVGTNDWKTVRVQCPEISDATFWRYVRAVRGDANPARSEDNPSPSRTLEEESVVPRLGALPAFYNPLEKARQYEALCSDAEALRAHAVDRRGRITNARQFEKSILLRERLLAQQAEIMNFFQSQETTKLFFDAIIEIVEELPKELKQKAMARLYEQQRRHLASS